MALQMGSEQCKQRWALRLLAVLLGSWAPAAGAIWSVQPYESGASPYIGPSGPAAFAAVEQLGSESPPPASRLKNTPGKAGNHSCPCSDPCPAGRGWSLSSFLGGLFLGIILSTVLVAALIRHLPESDKMFYQPNAHVVQETQAPQIGFGDVDKSDIPEVSPPSVEASPVARSNFGDNDGFAGGISPSGASTASGGEAGVVVLSPTNRRRKTCGDASKSMWRPPESTREEEQQFENQSLHLFWPRIGCLVIMLMIQSISSIILNGFEDLVQQHPSLVYFLTMLVGLGGNAGGQSVVLSVRRIALGDPVFVTEQLLVGMKMSLIIAPLAFVRAIVQHTSVGMSVTIALSSVIITIMGTTCGTGLPKILHMVWMDPAHAASIIQVLMDIGGITIVCLFGAAMVHIIPS